MLPRQPRDVTEATLDEVCRTGWPESQTLDFKQELPGVDARGRNEFLKDVCAMANADGGDLVYGIAEEDGAAHALAPVARGAADEAQRRLTQIVDGGIEPRVTGISMHAVPLGARGFVLVLRVPSSLDAPHRYRLENQHHRFVRRNGTVNSDMTYDQIRAAFQRSATLIEKARAFRAERCEAIATGRAWQPLPGPIAVVHLMPFAAFGGHQSVDVGALHDGNYMAVAQTRPRWGPMTSRTLNLDGLIVHPAQQPAVMVFAYSQVFRSGCLETARNARHSLHPGPEVIIPSTVLAAFVRNMVIAFTAAAVQLGFPGPAALGVSLLEVADVRLGLGNRYSRYIGPTADRRNLLVPETVIPALDGLTDVDSVVRPTLDILWQCFDEPRCLEYDAEGRWTDPQVI
jgi:hypothetical protein